jgi:hypothetical protein
MPAQRTGFFLHIGMEELWQSKKAGVFRTTASNMKIKIEAATESIGWLTAQEGHRAVIARY